MDCEPTVAYNITGKKMPFLFAVYNNIVGIFGEHYHLKHLDIGAANSSIYYS